MLDDIVELEKRPVEVESVELDGLGKGVNKVNGAPLKSTEAMDDALWLDEDVTIDDVMSVIN